MPGPTTATGGSSNAADALGDDAAGDPAPAAVQHRHPAAGAASATGRQSAVSTSSARPGRSVTWPSTSIRSGRTAPCPAWPGRCRAPAGPWPPRSMPSTAGQALAVRAHAVAVVVGEDAQVQRLVRALADAAEAGGEGDPGARQLDLDGLVGHAAPAISSAAASSCSRPLISPSSLRASVALQRAADGGGLGHARAQQVVAGDLQPHVAQAARPLQDRARAARPGPAPGPASRAARPPAAGPAGTGGAGRAGAAACDHPRGRAGGARDPVALGRGQLEALQPRAQRQRVGADQGGQAGQHAVGVGLHGPQLRAGHQLGVGVQLGVQRTRACPGAASALDRLAGLDLGQHQQQLVAHARARDGEQRAVLDRRPAPGARSRAPARSPAARRSARRAAGGWGRRRSSARAAPGSRPRAGRPGRPGGRAGGPARRP